MKKIIFLLIALNFALFTLNIFAQQNKIDSLLTLLKTDKADTNKVNHLNAFGRLLMYQNPDTGIVLGNQALEIISPIASSEYTSAKKGEDSYQIRVMRANT